MLPGDDAGVRLREGQRELQDGHVRLGDFREVADVFRGEVHLVGGELGVEGSEVREHRVLLRVGHGL